MVENNHPHTPSSSTDGDGVRVIRKARTHRPFALVWIALALAVIGAVVIWRLQSQKTSTPTAADAEAISESATAADHLSETASGQRAARRLASQSVQANNLPNNDPNDLANYFRPGDPEPTGAELIGALHDVGIHTGIGAFNPPGTSPPLEGLAVPADYPLPEGYVRHHQSTDAGVAIEPILMFAPGFTLYDGNGQPIAMPANRVVPISLAPPGLPQRWVHIPRP